jgi:hypothetical protein
MSHKTKSSPDLRLRSQCIFRFQSDRNRMPFTLVNETQSRLPSAILASHHNYFAHIICNLHHFNSICVMPNNNKYLFLICNTTILYMYITEMASSLFYSERFSLIPLFFSIPRLDYRKWLQLWVSNLGLRVILQILAWSIDQKANPTIFQPPQKHRKGLLGSQKLGVFQNQQMTRRRIMCIVTFLLLRGSKHGVQKCTAHRRSDIGIITGNWAKVRAVI